MVAISPTQQERRAAHMADALAAIVRAKSDGDTSTVASLQTLYENAATNARLYAARQEAEAAFNAAHRAYADHGFNSKSGHAATIAKADQLVQGGVSVFPVRTFDGVQDPAALLEGAALFEALAAACRE